MNENRYEAYCRQLVQGLCEEPDRVRVVKTIDERGVLLTVSGISRDDMRKVVGKMGAHAKAMRILIKAAGAAENARVSLKIEEPEEEEASF